MIRLIAALLILVVIASCTKPQDLTFIDISNIRMIKMGFTESEVGLDVRFYNPNNQRVQLKDADARVYVNSTYLGDTRMDSTIGVPRRDTFAVPLILNIKTVSVLSKLMETLADSAVNIKVEGTVKMGKAGLYKTFPIVYDKVQSVEELKTNFGM